MSKPKPKNQKPSLEKQLGCLREAAGAGRRAACHVDSLVNQIDRHRDLFGPLAAEMMRQVRSDVDSLVHEVDAETERLTRKMVKSLQLMAKAAKSK